MKKILLSIPDKSSLVVLFFTIAGITTAFCNPTPPPPPNRGFQPQSPVEIDFYMTQFIVIGILFTIFYVIKKITRA